MIGIGVDIGGTKTKIAVIDRNRKILELQNIPTPLSNGYEGFISEMCSIISKLVKKYKALKIGLAVAGDVDSYEGILRFAPNLCGWRDKKIKSDIEKVCEVEVMVENDANMAIWGAYVFELGKKYKNIAGFTLGTGVGGGIIIDGKLYKGLTTTAGEFGHIVIKEGGLLCACGNKGCLEAYCSTKRICEMAVLEIEGVDKNITPKDIYEMAKDGNQKAKKIWFEYGRYLGYGIGNIAVSLNPEVVVIAGGISQASEFFMEGVRETLMSYGIRKPIDLIKIHIASTKDLGAVGCADFAMEGR